MKIISLFTTKHFDSHKICYNKFLESRNFMDRTEAVTLTNMCMIKKQDKILVLNRNDPVWPGLTFPGGHVEKHEAFHDSVIREVQEETGLTIKDPKLIGVKQFFDAQDHRYLVFFYLAQKFTGQLRSSEEGELTWMTKDQLFSHKLASNFDHDLPIFFDPQLSEHILDGKRDEIF